MTHISFNKGIFLSDTFLTMTDGAIALYLLLLVLADREGLCDRELALKIGDHTNAEIRELTANGYIIEIENVIAIRHWYYHCMTARRAKKSTAFLKARDALIVRNWLYEMKPITKD